MKYEYLIFNFLVCLFPLIGKLWIKNVGIDWKRFFWAWAPVAIVFITLDYFVTGGWWNFNENFILGANFGNRLPIEEILFFVTVPWACVTLWEATYHHNLEISGKTQVLLGRKWWVIAGVIFWVVWGWEYTALMLLGLGIVENHFIKLWTNKVFWLFFGVLIVVFNGYLTSRPVVLYQDKFKSGLNLITIPVEDIIFGYILVGGVIYRYQFKKIA